MRVFLSPTILYFLEGQINSDLIRRSSCHVECSRCRRSGMAGGTTTCLQEVKLMFCQLDREGCRQWADKTGTGFKRLWGRTKCHQRAWSPLWCCHCTPYSFTAVHTLYSKKALACTATRIFERRFAICFTLKIPLLNCLCITRSDPNHNGWPFFKFCFVSSPY